MNKHLRAQGIHITRENKAPRSKLRGILRNSPKPLPSFAKATEGSPRLHPRSKLRGIRRRRITVGSENNRLLLDGRVPGPRQAAEEAVGSTAVREWATDETA